MKRWLTMLLLLVLVLSGCTPAVPGDPQDGEGRVPVSRPSLQSDNHSITWESGGALTAYPLEGTGHRLYAMGSRLLLTSQSVEGLTLQLLSGAYLDLTAVLPQLDGDVQLWAGQSQVLLLDSVAGKLLRLDERLREVDRIPLPEASSMAADQELTTLYYTQGQELWAMDLENGISRLVRRTPGRSPELLAAREGYLVCRSQEGQTPVLEVLSCTDGRAYYMGSQLQSLELVEDCFAAVFTDGPVTEYLYGTRELTQRFLGEPAQTYRLLSADRLLTRQDHKLALYDMKDGVLHSAVTAKNLGTVENWYLMDGKIWFLSETPQRQILCSWEPELSKAQAVQCLGPRYTAQEPDQAALAACQDAAGKLSEEFGIQVTLQVPEALQGHCRWETEHQPAAIQQALGDIGQALKQLPQQMLRGIESITESGSITLCLVRSVRGAAGEPLPDQRGTLLWVEGDAYLLVAVGEDSLTQFYHQFWHLTDTYLLNRNSILDTWDTLNPEGFSYANSYADYEALAREDWLTGPGRAFVDAFSMTYPREDRARVLEYAIQPGNAELFQSEILQAKLESACKSIRKAYKWNQEEQVFPWEQYLKEPLASA